MKTSLLAAAILSLSIGILRAEDPLAQARACSREGEFEKAAKLFEESLEKSPPSAAVFFELGRAYTKSGHEARAALSFRRALVLDPRFVPARLALQETNTALGIPVQRPDWRTQIAEKVPLDPVAFGGTALFWCGAFLGLASFLSRGVKARRFVLASVSGLAGVALLALVWLCDPRITMARSAIVLTNGGTSLLGSPADQSEKVAALPQGSIVDVLSQRGRWFYGRLPGGARGWFLTEGIVPVIPPA